MQKQIIPSQLESAPFAPVAWLDLESLANVQITSEASGRSVESALMPRGGAGWRGAQPGAQVVRLVFPVPQEIKRIRLVFVEEETPRTQEFTLRWRSMGAAVSQQLLRQQYVFSPPSTTRQVEEYSVHLPELVELELCILPDINGASAIASLSELRLA